MSIEYAGFGSGFGLSLDWIWDGRILGGLNIRRQQYKIELLFHLDLISQQRATEIERWIVSERAIGPNRPTGSD